MTIREDLDLINRYQKEITLFGRILSLLGWDQQTYMPEKGAEERAEQISLITSLYHEKMISKELFNALERVNNELDGLEENDKIMVERLHKDVLKARKLPKEFVEKLAKATSLSFSKWQEAKKQKNFELFRPYLEEVVKLKRQEAKYLGLYDNSYDTLLDDFEEGMTSDKLTKEFDKLKEGLIELLKKIEKSEEYISFKSLIDKKDFPEDKQLEFAKDVFKRIGMTEDVSRIDMSEHPFTTRLADDDVRITTNVRKNPLLTFHSTIHESGHALYDLGIPKEFRFSVLRDSPSLGIHESQSRFWENMVGKGKPFWNFYFPLFDKKFNLENNFEQWFREVNKVFPGKIRIESDEVHYALHVILRFEIERALINGEIEAKDLPEIWNKKMKEYFGLDIENDSEGVMQDVHWSQGYFGYFPTYVLGTIYSAQLYKQLKKEIPDIENDIEKGDFSRIKKWLNEKIHKHGRKFLAEDLIKNICGEGLNVSAFLDYLNEKYSKIYNLPNQKL